MRFALFYEIPVAGQEVCILGRGTTLGRPLALLLSQKRPTANAAVTVVHTGIPDWPRYTQLAVEFHLRNATAWANARVGEDLAAQIDPTFVLGPTALAVRA